MIATMAYGTTKREDRMASAAFYVGMGEQAELIATAADDASTGAMDDAGLFGPATTGEYEEGLFRSIALQAMADAGEIDHPQPDLIYVFKNGSVLVFEYAKGTHGEGYYQVALHYPNGARRPQAFPGMV